MPSPPPPLYQPSDEISLDDPIAEPTPASAPPDERPPSSFDGPEPVDIPTRTDQRPARPFRAFWLSFAANSSAAGIVVGGLLFSSGMSLRQTVVAGLIGVVLAGLLLVAIGRLGRRSGLPVLAASASVFGPRGNLLPVAIVLLARVVTAGVLLWIFGAAIARISDLAGVGPGGAGSAAAVAVAGAAVCSLLAATGYRGIVAAQRVLSPAAAAAVVWFVLASSPAVDLPVALTIGDGPGVLVASGVVTVLVLAGLLLLPATGDTARFQQTTSSGPLTGLWTALGAGVPALVIVTYGAILAASAPETADGLLSSPVDAVAAVLPDWYALPLAIAIAVATLPSAVLSLYSASLTTAGTMHPIPRIVVLAVAGVASAVIGVLLALAAGADTAFDLITTVAVPLAAWAGVLVGRSVGLAIPSGATDHDVSPVRWIPIATVVVTTAIGYGLTTATTGWLSWQGFLLPPSAGQQGDVAMASDPGILVVLLLAALASILRRRSGPQSRSRGSHRRP